jgi:hypothetical protein
MDLLHFFHFLHWGISLARSPAVGRETDVYRRMKEERGKDIRYSIPATSAPKFLQRAT